MATTFYERHNPRHRAWSKGHVPAIREAIKDAVSVARRMNLSRLPDESDPDLEAGYVMGERLGVADELPIPTHPGAPA